MVFTTGQMLGIGLFTLVVLAVGWLLLKLQSMIDGNAEIAEAEPRTIQEPRAEATPETKPHPSPRRGRLR